MIPTILKDLKLPEGYDLFFGDSCIIPVTMDYRLFEPKLWYVTSGVYTAAVIDLNKRSIVVKDNRYLSSFEEQGRILKLDVRFEKADPKEFINRHVITRPRNLFG